MRTCGTLLVLVTLVAVGCGRGEGEKQQAVPASPVRDAGGADAEAKKDPMTESRYTRETDRAVSAYLDRFDPFFTALSDEHTALLKRVGALQRGAVKDEAERRSVCEALSSTMERATAWQSSSPLPSALSDEELPEYQRELAIRMTTDKDSEAVWKRVAAFAGIQGSNLGAAGIVENLRRLARELAC